MKFTPPSFISQKQLALGYPVQISPAGKSAGAGSSQRGKPCNRERIPRGDEKRRVVVAMRGVGKGADPACEQSRDGTRNSGPRCGAAMQYPQEDCQRAQANERYVRHADKAIPASHRRQPRSGRKRDELGDALAASPIPNRNSPYVTVRKQMHQRIIGPVAPLSFTLPASKSIGPAYIRSAMTRVKDSIAAKAAPIMGMNDG